MNEKNLHQVVGDLLNFPTADYIAHQCNCVSTKYSGLAKSIFEKYPYSNTYNKNFERRMGTVATFHKPRGIINMYAQIYPGPAQDDCFDSKESRLRVFKTCLAAISSTFEVKSVAFPFKIGCGLAKGNWRDYYSAIKEFAIYSPDIQVYIVEQK